MHLCISGPATALADIPEVYELLAGVVMHTDRGSAARSPIAPVRTSPLLRGGPFACTWPSRSVRHLRSVLSSTSHPWASHIAEVIVGLVQGFSAWSSPFPFVTPSRQFIFPRGVLAPGELLVSAISLGAYWPLGARGVLARGDHEFPPLSLGAFWPLLLRCW
jgi:hypothetical protein